MYAYITGDEKISLFLMCVIICSYRKNEHSELWLKTPAN